MALGRKLVESIQTLLQLLALLRWQTIERLLTAEVMELRYTNLEWAVDHLKMLLRGAV